MQGNNTDGYTRTSVSKNVFVAEHNLGTITGAVALDFSTARTSRKRATTSGHVTISGATWPGVMTGFLAVTNDNGSRTIAWPGGWQATGMTLDSGVGTTTVFMIDYDGTTVRVAKPFSVPAASGTSGTYTPTATPGDRVATVDLIFPTRWWRIGNEVFVQGGVQITLDTNAPVEGNFSLSLPVARGADFSSYEDALGTGTTAETSLAPRSAAFVHALGTTETVAVEFIGTTLVAEMLVVTYQFSYSIP